MSNPALKEWASICQALLQGHQSILLRKGGIAEIAGRFSVEVLGGSRRFWLYATYEHQRSELLKPGLGIDEAGGGSGVPAPGWVSLPAWAELCDIIQVSEPAALALLDDLHVFSADYAAQRLHWKPRQPLFALLVRVYRPDGEPPLVPFLPEYAGCTSWVNLGAEAPAPSGGTPVLDEARFEAVALELRNRLRDRPGVVWHAPSA
jgi:hypothetical protein